MEITPHQIKVRDLVRGYKDNAEAGVVGFDGQLDIRPPYQREFVYDDKKRTAVIISITKSYPLNIMYWVVKEDGNYEVLDGQQRTISVAQYVNNDFAIDGRYFENLTGTEREVILDYELTVYFCEGTDIERLEWFGIINVAGEVLTQQELRNATYAGPWLSDARFRFSKPGCVAQQIANDRGALLKGKPLRQDYLETVLRWISRGDINEYMAKHQFNAGADELLSYFKSVIKWTRATFKTYRSEMNGLPWGDWYNTYSNGVFDANAIDKEISSLMADDDVMKKTGIYAYILTREEKHLSIRVFDARTKRSVYEQQGGVCPYCHESFKIEDMDADHITSWSQGGKTIRENCQVLCRRCNQSKGCA